MYLAVDIGGTKTLIASFNESGEIVNRKKVETNTDYGQFIVELKSNIVEVCPLDEIKAIAVAVPGHVEDDNGIVEGFGNLAWQHKDIKQDLSDLSVPVIVDNDANFGAVGEANLGAGKGKRKVLYVTISTGIGTGITIDGQIDPAMRESEGGQIILTHDGMQMPWEKFASGKAFLEHYGQQGKDVDDPAIWEEFSSNIAQGMWDLIALVQPDVVVIGGSIGEHFHKYGEFLNQAMQEFSSPVVDQPQIVQAMFPNEAVINGCYQAAKQYVDVA